MSGCSKQSSISSVFTPFYVVVVCAAPATANRGQSLRSVTASLLLLAITALLTSMAYNSTFQLVAAWTWSHHIAQNLRSRQSIWRRSCCPHSGLVCQYGCLFNRTRKLNETIERLITAMFLTFIFIVISIPSPPQSFISGLKPSYSFSSSWLTPQIPRTIYRYFWAYQIKSIFFLKTHHI